MAIPNFFSVERKGYTKVSDLFADVMKDMIENGFTKINSSNDYPLRSWKANIQYSGPGWKVGDKLYIIDGVRPTSPKGIARPAPYVQVTAVSTATGVTTATNTSGTVAKTTDVISSYDFPIWTVEPTGNLTLISNITANTVSNVYVTLSNVEIARDVDTRAITNAPMYYSFVLEAGGNVDPLNGTTNPNTGSPLAIADRQPWRVQFVISDEQKVQGSVATKLQMSYDEEAGRVMIAQITDDFGTVVDNVGSLGAVQPGGVFSDDDLNQGFYNRKLRVANTPQTFPLSYMLVITSRGFFLGVYEGSWSTQRASTTSNSNYFNWVLVQRPVDRNTGKTLTTGKAPVFQVNGVNYKYYRSVIREADILHPTSGPSAQAMVGNILISAGSAGNAQTWTATAIPDPTTLQTANLLVEAEVGGTFYDSKGYILGKIKSIRDANVAVLVERPKSNIGNVFVGNNVSFTANNWQSLSTVTQQSFLAGVDYFYTPANLLALRQLADAHSPDSHAIFNGTEQVSLTEDKTYLLSFPHNLTTPRFRYTEELDMIGTTSADVVMAGQEIQFTTYGESGPRTYRALPASGALNTGFRLAVLWAPTGPTWVTPEGNLRDITAGDSVTVPLSASKVNDGETRGDPTFEIARGSLPSGLALLDSPWRIEGTVLPASYTESTAIKFTIAAKNAPGEDSGYALRDFWFTYNPQ